MKRAKKNSSGGLRKILLSPGASFAAFALAAVLLLFAGIGGARATLTYISEYYSTRVQMYDIGVELRENKEAVSWRNYKSDADGTWDETTGVLLAHMLDKKDADGKTVTGEDGKPVLDELVIGKAYPEVLTFKNTGNINQFIRVSIYKYWQDPEGNKITNLSPSLIDLKYDPDTTGSGGNWIHDTASSTDEREVYYYKNLLKVGDETDALTKSVAIDNAIASKVTQTETKTDKGTTITTTYDYDGYSFMVEAKVDAVQEHNASDAVLSAWGQDVSISDDGSTLKLQ